MKNKIISALKKIGWTVSKEGVVTTLHNDSYQFKVFAGTRTFRFGSSLQRSIVLRPDTINTLIRLYSVSAA